MTNEEVKNWFLEIYNNCYIVKSDEFPRSIFKVYDINYIRSKKLANIIDKDISLPLYINGKILFDIYDNSTTIWVDKYIWTFIFENLICDLNLAEQLLNIWLGEYLQISNLSILYNNIDYVNLKNCKIYD